MLKLRPGPSGAKSMHSKAEIVAAKQRHIRERMDRAISLVLAATRRELRMSQPDLAVELGWTRNEIANVERLRRRVTAAEIVMFANVFRISPESLWRRILAWYR